MHVLISQPYTGNTMTSFCRGTPAILWVHLTVIIDGFYNPADFLLSIDLELSGMIRDGRKNPTK
jgi:hypothetical protein